MESKKNLRKLFGTDGIRGVANVDLTPEFVLSVGKAGARFFLKNLNSNCYNNNLNNSVIPNNPSNNISFNKQKKIGNDVNFNEGASININNNTCNTNNFDIYLSKKIKKFSTANKVNILIGRDTRPSGDFISAALTAGMLASGVNVLDAQIITTPAVALLVKILNLDGGVVISASHNPVNDNGIKFFGKFGNKLSDEQEHEIENYILEYLGVNNNNEKICSSKEINPIINSSKKINSAENQKLKADSVKLDSIKQGTIKKDILINSKSFSLGRYFSVDSANKIYLDYLKKFFILNLSGYKIAIDCANGAASILGPLIFENFGAKVMVFNNDLSGYLINKDCGATHPEFISSAVKNTGADFGVAFDGDADRVIICDENGIILDGDIIIGACAIFMKKNNILNNNCVVTTVMANMGFDKAMKNHGIKVYKTDVGDRYVLEEMHNRGSVLGGEQSGHIILKNISPTGDGIISALEFFNVIQKSGFSSKDLLNIIPKFPQVLKNVKVIDKNFVMSSEVLKDEVGKVEKELGDRGRILVRKSGTESLIRVMVEAEDEQLAVKLADEIVAVIEKISKFTSL